MSKFNTAITEAMEALDAEIADVKEELAQLESTRANLETVLVEDDGDSPKKSRKSVSTIKVTDKRTTGKESTKRERIMHMLEDDVKVSVIAEKLEVSPNYVYTIKRDMPAGERGKKSRGGRSRTSNGNGGSRSGTKRDRIKRMLDNDMSVKDIADELGISPGYVYNVKREVNA